MAEIIIPQSVLEYAEDTALAPVELDVIRKRLVVEVGYFVVGIKGMADFNIVEDAICQTLSPMAPKLDRAIEAEPTLMSKRVADHLRPPQFNGTLLNGYAVILPFSAEKTSQIDQTRRKDYEAGKLTDERIGLHVLFGGDLRKTNRGIAPYRRPASYYQRLPVRGKAPATTNRLARSIQPFSRSEPLVWGAIPAKPEDECGAASNGSRFD